MKSIVAAVGKRFLVIVAAVAICFISVPAPRGGVLALKGTREIEVNYQNLTIEINNRIIIPKDAAGNSVFPFVYNDRTYLPVRALVNALGCGVAWNDEKKTVEIESSGGPGPVYGAPPVKDYSEIISVEYDNVIVTLDGKKLTINNEPFLFKDSVYLPVREIADALNCTVAFTEATNVISIIDGNRNMDSVQQSNQAKTNGSAYPASSAGPAGPKESEEPAGASISASGTISSAPKPTPVPSNAAKSTEPARTAEPVATTAPAPPTAIENSGSFSSADLAFIIAGKTVKLDQNISVIKDLLGTPKEYDEVESCAYTGLDKFYVYDGLEISTLPIGGDSICAIDVFNDKIMTTKDITVGGTKAKIETVYGKDYTLENGVLIYWAGSKGNPKTPQLYFMLDKNDIVESFGMYNGKSAG